MIGLSAFKSIIGIIIRNRAKETEEHLEFLQFYRSLVSSTPSDIASDFGMMPVKARVGRVIKDWWIELNPTDLLWWISEIEHNGARFEEGISTVRQELWSRLNQLIDYRNLSDEDREALLIHS